MSISASFDYLFRSTKVCIRVLHLQAVKVASLPAFELTPELRSLSLQTTLPVEWAIEQSVWKTLLQSPKTYECGSRRLL